MTPAAALLTPPRPTGVCAARTVSDAMNTRVRLSGPDTTVGELRALFVNEHVHSAVIVDRDVLLAVVDRGDLDGACDADPAAVLGSLGARVTHPDTDLADATGLLLASGRRRLAVVGDDGRLRGLLCLKRTRRGFCSHRDLAARAASLRS